MRRKIYLIGESRKDSEIITAILKKKQIERDVEWVRLSPLSNKPGSISRLKAELSDRIEFAKVKKKTGDCIAVVHDLDENSEPKRAIHDEIKRICKAYQADVFLVVAEDEIESWLLSDEGVCSWLGEKHENKDGDKKPSKVLNRLLDEKFRMKFQGPRPRQGAAKGERQYLERIV